MFPPALPSAVLWLDLLVAAVVLAATIKGAQAGLFRSTIAALMAVTAFLVPLGLVNPLARWLTSMDAPPRAAPILAFLLLLAATSAGIRRLTSRMVSEGVMRLPRVVDVGGGGALGAIAGAVIAGNFLVAGSILPIPPPFRANPRGNTLDAGAWMLDMFAHCLEADRRARSILFEGEPPTDGRRAEIADGNPDEAAAAAWRAAPCAASEPFVDTNRNGRHDEKEVFLDTDGNETFSPRLLFDDTNANGRRDIGLLERYRLGHWHLVTQLTDADDEENVAAEADVCPDDAP